jgi:hypothetical protein
MEPVSISLEPLRASLAELGHFLPRLALALGILLAGWLVAKALNFATVKALRAVNFHIVTEKAGVDGALRQSGVGRDTTAIIGVLIYWVVILAALIVAFNTLGLGQVAELLKQILLFVPNVIVGVLVVAFGTYFARFVATALEAYFHSIGVADAALLGKLAFYAIVVFVVLTALDRLQVTGELVRVSFLIILAGLVLALALAFGLGGQSWAAELIERWRAKPGPRDAANRTQTLSRRP